MWTFFKLGSWSRRAQTLSNCLPSSTTRMEQLLCSKIYLQAWVGGKIDKKKLSYVVVFQFFYLGSIGWVDSCCESSSKDCSNIRYHPFRCIEAKNTHTVESGKNMIAMQTLQDFLFSRNEFQPCKTQRNECFRNSSHVLVVVCPRPRFLKVCISTIFKVRGLVN